MTVLKVEGLSLSYGRTAVLQNVSLPPVHGGSLVGILGANGVGKSTFLRALAGLQDYAGDIFLDDEELSKMTFLSRVGRVGYLPQVLPQATTLVAYEAVISACRAVRPDLSLEEVDLAVEEVFDRLGIRHLAFRALNQLSGGQRQMVGLAQVIVRKPTVMLLDEPTSALDLRWQIGVFDVVRSILRQRSGICLMALHDINLALRHCDYIGMFADGQLLSFGPPSEAMTSDVLRQAYRVEGRVETCSNGTPFVVTDGLATIDNNEKTGSGQNYG